MAKFRVKDGNTVDRNGKVLAAGEVLDLSVAEADAMPWAVEPVADAKPKADK